MKKCPKCNEKMILLTSQKGLLLGHVEKKSNNYFSSTIGDTVHYAQIYVCSKCGFIEQYATKTFLDNLDNLE